MDTPSPRAPRAEILATLAIVGVFAAVVIGRPIARRLAPHPSPDRCAAMLDRYAEHRAAQYNRARPEGRLGAGAPDAMRCARELTQGEVECAMKANNADEVERCLP
jgi:hypothetical protein